MVRDVAPCLKASSANRSSCRADRKSPPTKTTSANQSSTRRRGSWRAMNRSCPSSRGRGARSRCRNSSPSTNNSEGPNRGRRPSWEERRQPARRARGDRSRPVDNYRSRQPIEKRHFSTPHFSLGKAQTEKCRTEKFRAPGLSPQQQVKRMNAVNTEGEAYE